MRHLGLLLPLLLFALSSPAQPKTIEVPYYDFVNYKANYLRYDTSSVSMTRFFQKWKRLEKNHQGNLNIVHIGGSHVQAGTMSNTIRCNLLHAYPSLIGGRGIIFPYSAAARCNNPTDYRVHCQQKVGLTRNVFKSYPFPLGVCGISITASDITTEVTLVLNEPSIDYTTNHIVLIGHSDNGVTPQLRIDNRNIYPSYVDSRTDRFVFNLSHPTDSFSIILPCRKDEQFILSGVYLDNRHSGFSFHSIGVNGAAVNDYLRCENFVRDLRLLHPDMVIFGIGINDANGKNFDTLAFKQNYLQLINSIRTVNPDCAFVFITNNDSFKKIRKRRYEVNRNGLLARDVFYRLAEETDGAVWDQFEIMGGLKSMDRWRKASLAQTDRVHFTRAGYQLCGNLLYNALIEAYINNTKRRR